MKRIFLSLLAITALSACTPSDIEYCNRMGTPEGSPEFGNCMQHFHKMNGMFDRDRQMCEGRARQTYPDYLYDEGKEVETVFKDENGKKHRGTTRIPPDYAKNEGIDDMRNGIIVPCMMEKGWNSPDDWEAGRSH